MENRNGLAVDLMVMQSNGTVERGAGLSMAMDLPGSHRKTLGGDKNYDAREFVEDVQALGVTPHVAQKARSSAIDGRTTRHPGYDASQKV